MQIEHCEWEAAVANYYTRSRHEKRGYHKQWYKRWQWYYETILLHYVVKCITVGAIRGGNNFTTRHHITMPYYQWFGGMMCLKSMPYKKTSFLWPNKKCWKADWLWTSFKIIVFSPSFHRFSTIWWGWFLI